MKKGHKVHLLDYQEDNFNKDHLLAIHSNKEAFQIAYFLNKFSDSIFRRKEDIALNYKEASFSLFKWENSFSFHNQKSWYGLVDYQAKQIIGFSQLTWHKSLGNKNNLLSGFALRYNSYNDNTAATLKADNWWLPGIFVQDNFKFSDNQQLLFGWRTDFHSKHGFINSPRINYQLNITENSSLRIGYGDGFRVVNIFTEDHAALTGAREIIFLEELEPEKSKNLNINLSNSWNSDNLQITLESSVFESIFSNKIIPDFLTNDNQIIYSNLSGYAIARGISSEIFLKMYKIPLKLSSKIKIAHKTGTYFTGTSDCGIVYPSNHKGFIICLYTDKVSEYLSNGEVGFYRAKKIIGSITLE